MLDHVVMTQRRDIVERWVLRLGLAAWDVRLSQVPPPPGNRARVDMHPECRIAVIRIHELLHVALHGLARAAALLQAHTPPDVDRVFDRVWGMAEHGLIEQLASVLTGQQRQEFDPESEPYWLDAFGVRP